MNLKTFIVKITAILVLLGCPSFSHAAQYKELGEWDVHYIVLNTSFFTPEIARQYGLQRSKFKALVNISVLNSDDQKAQSVAMSGTARNLLGTTKKLEFDKVQEGDAIYYLATISFRHQETYNFNIEVRDGNEVQTLSFKHKFYAE